MFYSVVLLDGNEIHCLSIEEVRDLFFRRQINQDSLICSAEDGQWKILRRTFDLTEWISQANSAASAGQNYQPPPVNPFEQTKPVSQPENFQTQNHNFAPTETAASQPVTFNQFPPNNSFAQNSANGYSQNNQTETYYQAETSQSNYNFQNIQTEFAPSRYNNAAGSYNYSTPDTNNSDKRRALKPAAVFLLINIFFYVVFVVFGALLTTGEENSAMKLGEGIGGLFIPVLIDLIFVTKLWKLDDLESARKWGLFRSYYSLIAFGVILPFVCFSMGEIAGGFFSLVSAFFFCLSLALVLHGKQQPSTGRLVFGAATFVVYCLVMLGTLSLAVIGTLAPEIAKLDIQNSQFEKYKIEGTEYEDKITGAKVVLPAGWAMIRLDNPLIRTPEARMIAIDKGGNRLTMLEVVPVPGNLDMKRQNSTFILDQLSDNVVKIMNEQLKKNSFGGKEDFREITRLSIYIGKHPAKLLVFEKRENGEQIKGHMIITYDELTFYVLHSWCPADEYQDAQNDFTFFEKNFSVPEKINSTFTQSAENLKK